MARGFGYQDSVAEVKSISYRDPFDVRGPLEHRAIRRHPEIRAVERDTLLAYLYPDPEALICDVPSGGGYVADALAARGARTVCVDPSRVHVALAMHPAACALLTELPLRSASCDGLVSMAGLHHVDDKAAFVREAHRVLRPGGRIALCDVVKDGAVARFLDDAVDRYSETGHRGAFVAEGDLAALLTSAGFESVVERTHHYTWNAADERALLDFCRDLFGLVRADDRMIRDAFERSVGPAIAAADGAVRLPWSLAFASGRKPTDATTGGTPEFTI